MFSKTSKGQFFSLDVIAGSLIFLVAFFILAFYWLNAQAGMAEKTDDLQRESERIADLLMTPSQFETFTPDYLFNALDHVCSVTYPVVNDPLYNTPDKVIPVNYLGIVDSHSRIMHSGMAYLVYMSEIRTSTTPPFYFYTAIKEKLGIPRYEYYITIEDDTGVPLDSCIAFGYTDQHCFSYWSDPPPPSKMDCAAGAPPPATAHEVANAERIALFRPYTGSFDTSGNLQVGEPELVKLRVQVWRP